MLRCYRFAVKGEREREGRREGMALPCRTIPFKLTYIWLSGNKLSRLTMLRPPPSLLLLCHVEKRLILMASLSLSCVSPPHHFIPQPLHFFASTDERHLSSRSMQFSTLFPPSFHLSNFAFFIKKNKKKNIMILFFPSSFLFFFLSFAPLPLFYLSASTRPPPSPLPPPLHRVNI